MNYEQKILDKNYRVRTFYWIRDKQGRRVLFRPNRAQSDFEQKKHSRNIILKSRQLGFSTLEAIDMLDDALFTRNFDGLFIAQDLDTAKDLFSSKIEYAWMNFPQDLKNLYLVNADSARKLLFDFGDGTRSSVTVDSSGRAGTFRRLHITEYASVCKNYPDKAKEVLTGSIPAIPTDGRVDIESTAQESEGLFYELFWEAYERGEPEHPTQFKAHFYNWRWDEEVNE